MAMNTPGEHRFFQGCSVHARALSAHISQQGYMFLHMRMASCRPLCLRVVLYNGFGLGYMNWERGRVHVTVVDNSQTEW